MGENCFPLASQLFDVASLDREFDVDREFVARELQESLERELPRRRRAEAAAAAAVAPVDAADPALVALQDRRRRRRVQHRRVGVRRGVLQIGTVGWQLGNWHGLLRADCDQRE